MQSKKLDVLAGLFILCGILALLFLIYKVSNTNLFSLNKKTYYVLTQFDDIGNLKVRSAVKSAGVLVGRVDSITYNNQTFKAFVKLNLDRRYSFPKDTSAKILNTGLLGEQYISLEPGNNEQNLAVGDTIQATQSAVILENLISQCLYVHT